MTENKEATLRELYEDIELWFDGVEGAVGGRCYPVHSAEGVRYIQRLVRGHLDSIDELLLEIERKGQG